jgi:holliday junction DNA helicase RuvA
MIGFLSGKVIGKINSRIILRLPGGVGYVVNISPLRQYLVNENVDLFVHQSFSKDGQSELFGFDSIDDRNWVEKLTKVSGIGNKSAANIIYYLGSNKVSEAIQNNQPEIFNTVKGLGKKNSQKIILELRKYSKFNYIDNINQNNEVITNFIEALGNLGYSRSEIVQTISKMKRDSVWNEEEGIVTLIKKGLQYLTS